jgi:polygalacturonase
MPVNNNLKLLALFSGAILLAGAGCTVHRGGHTSWDSTRNGKAIPVYNVKDFGARGDGQQPDTRAINEAILAASVNGGGTVWFPAGIYLSFSIHLKSNISLYLDAGAILLADEPSESEGGYDPPEPNIWGDSLRYQDFGHSHWHNSLIWGENLENVSILGPGLIHGAGLIRGGNRTPGLGNKAVALKNCRNVIIRDVSFLLCGHFCILATAVDNLTVDNLKIDSNRDGINIDCCRNVRISNCSVNTPNDDAIVLKSSFALGYARVTENLSITNCQVSGYDPGSFLDGTFKKNQEQAPDRGGVTGRIKLGTESNGGFRNISISNCVFDHCRGLALETVDGGILEDINISNLSMSDIVNSPIFIRLGSRMRGPEDVPVGRLRRVNISNVTVYNANPRYASLIMGIPGHEVEDVKLSNIQILVCGGAPAEQAQGTVPENEDGYPDPRMFGEIPAYGFFIRHVKGIEMSNVELKLEQEDPRPAFILEDVEEARFLNVKIPAEAGRTAFRLKDVHGFSTRLCLSVPDVDIGETAVREILTLE